MLVLKIASHPRKALAVIGAALTVCVVAAIAFLTISTDENRLFSDKVSFFKDYLQFIERFPENEAVYVVIEEREPEKPPALDRWTDLADRITGRLNAMTGVVMSAHSKIPLDELGKQGILFEDSSKLPAEMEDARRFVPLARLWGEQPDTATALLGHTPMERFLGGATITGDDETAGFVKTLADSWNKAIADPAIPMRVGEGVVDLKQLSAKDPSQLGYFYVANEQDRTKHRILVRVYPNRERLFRSLTAITEAVGDIRAAANQEAKDFPEFTVGVTGRPALDADQMKTTDKDSNRAEAIALVAVFIGMVIMLRSVWLALAAEIALGVGIGWTFGWATISVGQLNLLSLVFLIALIGIGMDYLVQILSRYRVEARRYSRPGAVWVRVFRYVGPPINTACLGAAGAFLVSIFTDFRGAANLGVIAGGGLILCLLAGYTVLPAILTIFPPRLKPYEASQRYKDLPPERGIRRLLLPGLWVAALAGISPFMSQTKFDPGLIDLQVPTLESVKLINTLQTWVAVGLSKDLQQLKLARDATANLPQVAYTESALNAQDNAQWLNQHANDLPQIQWADPTPLTDQDISTIATRARTLADRFSAGNAQGIRVEAAMSLRQFADALDHAKSRDDVAQRLSQWQTVFAGELRDLLEQFRPGPLDMKKLPVELRNHLMSEDGYYALYIYPKNNLWERRNLGDFTTAVEKAVKTASPDVTVTGIASNVYHTTDSIHRAFFEATIYALALIFVLVLLDFRKLLPTLAAISVLGLGLPMLVGIMGYIGSDWNFANFFGLPILIGAGHEYGVFMVHRYLEARSDRRRVWTTWDVSDRALLLCGFITSSSFGFFWLLAEHAGLKSLGLVMALGTACIYLATIMVLRPILRWRLERFHKSHSAGL